MDEITIIPNWTVKLVDNGSQFSNRVNSFASEWIGNLIIHWRKWVNWADVQSSLAVLCFQSTMAYHPLFSSNSSFSTRSKKNSLSVSQLIEFPDPFTLLLEPVLNFHWILICFGLDNVYLIVLFLGNRIEFELLALFASLDTFKTLQNKIVVKWGRNLRRNFIQLLKADLINLYQSKGHVGTKPNLAENDENKASLCKHFSHKRSYIKISLHKNVVIIST